jgi:hypothetical protein
VQEEEGGGGEEEEELHHWRLIQIFKYLLPVFLT